MSTQVGLTLVKRFTYRGDATEEYSNTYWLSGTVPSDGTAWRALFDAMVTAEKTIYTNATNVIRGYGYSDNSGHKSGDTGTVSPAVYSVDLTVAPNSIVPGSLSTGGVGALPGDVAVWVRWKTDRLNSKGKPIYLRKYFHPAYSGGSTSFDTILAAQSTALTAFGLKLRDGTFIDGRKVTAAGHTDSPSSHGVSAYVTTRTLKRRGKRPGS